MSVLKRTGVIAVLATVAAVAIAALGVGAARADSTTLYVVPTGSDTNDCSQAHPCRTIGHAVAVAHPGDRIVVEGGTYQESVTIAKRLHLSGDDHPVVDARGHKNGFLIRGPGSVGSSVRGFTIKNATQEGVLAVKTAWVWIAANRVVHNDLGMFSANPTGECAAQGEIPGDCGEGIHLMTVQHGAVVGNTATNNAGGILLTDEFGPTAHNLVGWNHVVKNQYDCGITIPGHSPNAVSSTGERQPDVAGVYDNLITHNVANQNGLKGEGAGILIAAGGPGSGAYDNVVSWNTANGNELAGVTIHSHAPGQDVNGNVITDNSLSHNNVGGDPDAGVFKTTDILVFSAVVPITGTVVHDNWLANAHFGIWTHNAHADVQGNHYDNVQVHVHQE